LSVRFRVEILARVSALRVSDSHLELGILQDRVGDDGAGCQEFEPVPDWQDVVHNVTHQLIRRERTLCLGVGILRSQRKLVAGGDESA